MTTTELSLGDICKEVELPLEKVVSQLNNIDIQVPKNNKHKVDSEDYEKLKESLNLFKSIKRVEVKGLWTTHNVIWNLDSDVNILIGDNGSGKSTLLNLIFALTEDLDRVHRYDFREIILVFNNDRILFFKKLARNEDELQAIAENIGEAIRSRIDWANYIMREGKQDLRTIPELKRYKLRIIDINLHDHGCGYLASNIPKQKNSDRKDKIDVNLISTFDNFLNVRDIFDSFSRHKYLKTELDLDLKITNDLFTSYQLNLRKEEEERIQKFNKNIKTITEQESVDSEKLSELRYNLKQINQIRKAIYADKNKFMTIINSIFKSENFSELNKSIDFDRNNNIIFKNQDSDHIRLDQISSGEKQMLLTLLTVLLQENQPGILLLDEPEISMHLRWQIELIDYIKDINPNLQIIIVTHAPGIVNKIKWQEKTTEISKLFAKKIDE